MKIAQLISCAIFYFMLSFVAAQEIQVQSVLLDNKFSVDASKNLGGDESGFYLASFVSKYKFEVGFNVTGSETTLVIQKYSNDLKLLAEKSIVQGDNESLEWPVFFGGQLYGISHKYTKKTKSWNIYAQKFEPAKLYNDGAEKLLYTVKQNEDQYGISLQIVESSNGKYLAFHSFELKSLGRDYGYELNTKFNDSYATTIAVFSEGFEKVWEKDVVMPHVEDKYHATQVQVNDNGEIYILGWRFVADVNKLKTNTHKAITSLHRFSNKGATLKELDLTITGTNILDAIMGFDKTGNVIITGLCNTEDDVDIIDAFFAIAVDNSTFAITNGTTKRFSQEFLDVIDLNSKARMAFSLDEMILMENGNLIFVIEEFVISQTQSGIIYSCLNLITVGIDENAEILWTTPIPKKQFSIGEEFTSYRLMQMEDKIHFLYNGNAENLNAKTYGDLEDYQVRNSVIILLTLNDEGNYKKVIFPADISPYLLRTNMSHQLTPTKFIFFARDGKKEYLGSMEFK